MGKKQRVKMLTTYLAGGMQAPSDTTIGLTPSGPRQSLPAAPLPATPKINPGALPPGIPRPTRPPRPGPTRDTVIQPKNVFYGNKDKDSGGFGGNPGKGKSRRSGTVKKRRPPKAHF